MNFSEIADILYQTRRELFFFALSVFMVFLMSNCTTGLIRKRRKEYICIMTEISTILENIDGIKKDIDTIDPTSAKDINSKIDAILEEVSISKKFIEEEAIKEAQEHIRISNDIFATIEAIKKTAHKKNHKSHNPDRDS